MNIERNERWWNADREIRRIHSRPGLWLRRWLDTRTMANSLGLLMALSLFLWSGPLLRLWDPTAGVLDVGILSMLVYALLAGMAMRLVALVGINQRMVSRLANLSSWQQMLFYGCLHLSYFWGMVTVLAVML